MGEKGRKEGAEVKRVEYENEVRQLAPGGAGLK